MFGNDKKNEFICKWNNHLIRLISESECVKPAVSEVHAVILSVRLNCINDDNRPIRTGDGGEISDL